MKIDRPTLTARPTPSEGKDASTRAQRSDAPIQSSTPAAVTHLSQTAGQSAAADIDQARVAEIRKAISEGRLEIRAERIADGLISSVRELLADDRD